MNKNNIRELLDKTDINVLDEINILEYIDELEQTKEEYIKSLDKLDVLENKIDEAIEYVADNMSYVVKGNKEYIPVGEDLLDILRGKDNDNNN